MDDSDDEPIDLSNALSAGALAALQDLAESQATESKYSNDPFKEDWGLSQFWYNDTTCATVNKTLCHVSKNTPIAYIACPSLVRHVAHVHPSQPWTLLEYDNRFATLGNFVFYDYNEPMDVPDEIIGAFEVVVADPPYLSEECIVKTMKTMKRLAKNEQTKMFILTGAVSRSAIWRDLRLQPVKFRPEHSNKLGNEFLLYTNCQESIEILGGVDEDYGN